MSAETQIAFGDTVRVRSTALTEGRGLARRVGRVFGETTPSITGVDVIGGSGADYAINVFFEDRNQAYWFAASLLEFVDHAPGTEITLEGVPKKWVRTEAGEWLEVQREEPGKRPWWKFW
ncbi:MAG: hypothetical protein M1453_06515 [Acidobacteria bacterium]|nr:hypothetical protein [Acidobacteriota bacterium]MCL5287629.1 hypothetical protein [Acidobacteriota bacterium]